MKDNDNRLLAMIVSTFLIWIMLVLSFMLTGCSSMKPTVIVQTRDSVRVQYVEKVDSVWRDRFHTVYEKGDTVFVRDSVFLYKYKFLTKTDSVVTRDSIPYPVEVVKEVRKRNWYDRAVSWGFWLLFLIIGGTAAWRIAKKYYLHI